MAFRSADKADAAHLAVLVDIASQGLVAKLWTTLAGAGQSPFELGRTRLRDLQHLPSHFSRWTVYEKEHDICGAFAGYVIPDPYDAGDVSDLPPAYAPLLELEALAKGSWFLMALAVFPEYRGIGIGRDMLSAAQAQAFQSNAAITLTVSTENIIARNLYLNFGFCEQAKRKQINFDGSPGKGEWLLLSKQKGGVAYN
jgi:ribosomal protein S18 acetylase RimI-like enzyme